MNGAKWHWSKNLEKWATRYTGKFEESMILRSVWRENGKEHTYGNALTTEDQVISQLRNLAEEVERSLKRTQKHGKTVVLKVRYADYSTITKRVTLPEYMHKKEAIFSQASLIWEEILGIEKGIRLLGITVTNLDPLAYENIVLPLWETE